MESNVGGTFGPAAFGTFERLDGFEAYDTPQEEESNQFFGEDWDSQMNLLNQQYEAMSPGEQQRIFDSAAAPQTLSALGNQQYQDVPQQQHQQFNLEPVFSNSLPPQYPVAAPSHSFRFNIFRYLDPREAAKEFFMYPIEGIFTDLSYYMITWNPRERKLERPTNFQDVIISYYNYVSLEIQPKSTAIIFLITIMHLSCHTAVHQWLFDCYLLATKIPIKYPRHPQIIESCNNIRQEIARLIGNVLVADMKTHSERTMQGFKPLAVFGKDVVPQVWTGQWADEENGWSVIGIPPNVELHTEWSRYFLEKATTKLMDDGIDPRNKQMENLLVIDLEIENAEGFI